MAVRQLRPISFGGPDIGGKLNNALRTMMMMKEFYEKDKPQYKNIGGQFVRIDPNGNISVVKDLMNPQVGWATVKPDFQGAASAILLEHGMDNFIKDGVYNADMAYGYLSAHPHLKQITDSPRHRVYKADMNLLMRNVVNNFPKTVANERLKEADTLIKLDNVQRNILDGWTSQLKTANDKVKTLQNLTDEDVIRNYGTDAEAMGRYQAELEAAKGLVSSIKGNHDYHLAVMNVNQSSKNVTNAINGIMKDFKYTDVDGKMIVSAILPSITPETQAILKENIETPIETETVKVEDIINPETGEPKNKNIKIVLNPKTQMLNAYSYNGRYYDSEEDLRRAVNRDVDKKKKTAKEKRLKASKEYYTKKGELNLQPYKLSKGLREFKDNMSNILFYNVPNITKTAIDKTVKTISTLTEGMTPDAKQRIEDKKRQRMSGVTLNIPQPEGTAQESFLRQQADKEMTDYLVDQIESNPEQGNVLDIIKAIEGGYINLFNQPDSVISR